MRILYKLLLFSYFIFLLSCGRYKENGLFPIIDLESYKATTIRISDYVDSIKYIQFDSTVIIPGFAYVHATDSFFFLKTIEGVLKYDHQGSFLHKIGNIGQGPGEYNKYHDFSLSKESRQVYVYNYPDRILSFTFDGKYLGQVEIEKSRVDRIPTGFHFINDSFYIFYQFFGGLNQPWLWEIIDRNGKIISTKRDYSTRWIKDQQVLPNHGGFIFYTWNNISALYWNHVNDTIYRVSDNEQTPAYLWAKSPLRVSKDYVENTKYLSPSNIIETDNYLFIRWIVNWCDRLPNGGYTVDGYDCIYDKSNGKLIGSKEEHFTDDINGGCLGRISYYAAIRGEEYIGVALLPEKLKNALLKTDTQKSRSLAATIDEEGNPVLVLMQMKKKSIN